MLHLLASLLLANPVPPPTPFGVETTIAWTLEVDVDGARARHEEGAIDAALARGLEHPALGVRCALVLTREHISYDPTGARGYTRDEERVAPSCTVGGYAITLGTVTCAKGAARNKVGTVFGDEESVRLEKDGRSFGLRVRCVVK